MRRRQRRKEENDSGQQTFLPYLNITNLARKARATSRIHQPRTLSKDHPIDNIPRVQDPMTNYSSTNWRISFTESTTLTTDLEESGVSWAAVVKRIKRAEIAKVNSIKKLNEAEDVHIKSTNHRDSNRNTSDIQHSSVTVFRMNKVSNMDKMNESNLNASQQKTSSMTSIIPTKSIQVNVIKIPRNKTIKNKRPRAASVGNLNIIQLDKSSMEMQSIKNHSEMSKHASDIKANIGNGVTVMKIPRKPATS